MRHLSLRPGTPSHQRAHVRAAAIAALVAASLVGRPALALASVCSAAAFGCPASGTCLVTGTWDIGSGCLIDFGSRAVEIRGTLQAATRSGAFEVRGGSLTLNAGKLKSLGDADEPGGAITVVTPGALVMRGSGPRIDTSGNGGGGDVHVQAASVDLQTGLITADGGADQNCGDGGTVDIVAAGGPSASAITLRATAGGECGGGEVALTGASVTVTGDIAASGGASVSDEAISLTALSGNVAVSGLATLTASGTGQNAGYGADGGQVTLSAPHGNVTLGGTSVVATGKSPYGSGGAVAIEASGNVVVSSRLVLSGGSNGYGGEVAIGAGGTLSVTGDIQVPGGASVPYGQGGLVDLVAGGPATIASTIDATALLGGDIAIQSSGAIDVTGQLTTRGSRDSGGTIELAGCVVTVAGRLDSGGSNGAVGGGIEIDAGEVALQSSAIVQATPCAAGGCVSAVTPSGDVTIDPAATVTPQLVSLVVGGVAVCD